MRVLLRMALASTVILLATNLWANAGTCSECISCVSFDGSHGAKCMYNGDLPDCTPGCDTSGWCWGNDLYGECVNNGGSGVWSFERHFLASINPAPLTVGRDWVVVAAQISTPHVRRAETRGGQGILSR